MKNILCKKLDEILTKQHVPQTAPAPGVYLKDVHGAPGGRSPVEWRKLFRWANGAYSKGKTRWDRARLFADACYFSTCARLLQAKRDVEWERLKYIVEQMRYPDVIMGG